MAVTKPLWVHTASHSGLDARLGTTAMFGAPTPSVTSLTRPGGVVPGYAGGLKVSQTTSPTMAVLVAAGAVQVPGAVSGQGDYLLVNDAPVSLTIGAYTGSIRTDIIIARVRDDSYGELSPGGYLEVVTGQPGGAVPSLPIGSSSIKIAEVAVGNVASIVDGVIVDKRTWAVAAGGVGPATTAGLPPTPYDGQLAYDTDAKAVKVYLGSPTNAWRTMYADAGAWTPYTPIWTAGTTNPILGTGGNLLGRYTKIGRTIHFTISLLYGTAGTGTGAGDYELSLPSAWPAAPITGMRWLCPAYFYDVNGGTEANQHWPGVGIIWQGTTTISQFRLACGDPTTSIKGGEWGSGIPMFPQAGDQFTVSGTYETTA